MTKHITLLCICIQGEVYMHEKYNPNQITEFHLTIHLHSLRLLITCEYIHNLKMLAGTHITGVPPNCLT